ncbi:MAG TPA: DUF481 domain-containing protein [Edaphobacter sp.]|nr:DUF481 domain-containing protein [Edaphobacter sp.]
MRIVRACFCFIFFFVFAVLFCVAGHASEADPPKPPKEKPDVLIFINGDQMTGKLVHSTGDTLTFHTDMAGDMNVSWSNVKELRSDRKFVVLPKGEHWSWHSVKNVAAGSIKVENKKIEVGGGEQAQVIPIKQTADVLDVDTFNREALQEVNFFRRWTGSATLGLTVVQATQNNYTYSSSAALVRNTPTVSYLPPRNRTAVNFSGSYSSITQRQAEGAPVLPDLKTSIYHVDSERDEYVSSRIYMLAQTAFDHNFSQGLDLQQIYGGGVGWTVLRQPQQTLDLRATLQYEKQSFLQTAAQVSTNLVGSTFSLNYTRNLPLKAVFQQQMQYLPAYNQPEAYSASESNSITFPLYKRFRFQVGTLDSYLNNPPVAIFPAPLNRRNSLQFTTGISYVLK